MTNSLLLAKVVGPYCVVVALSFLLKRQDYQQVSQSVLGNSGVKLLGGFFALVVGLLIVNAHNVWRADWRVIITLIGWLALVKGIVIFLFPEAFAKFADRYRQNTGLVRFQLGVTLLLGVILCLKGYF